MDDPQRQRDGPELPIQIAAIFVGGGEDLGGPAQERLQGVEVGRRRADHAIVRLGLEPDVALADERAHRRVRHVDAVRVSEPGRDAAPGLVLVLAVVDLLGERAGDAAGMGHGGFRARTAIGAAART